MKIIKITFLLILFSYLNVLSAEEIELNHYKKKIAYIVPNIEIPFWKIMSRGIKDNANNLGYDVTIYTANNIKKIEIQNTIEAIKNKVDAIILSPVNSSSAVTILKFAKKANIPVIISDIGADKGEYLSFISSNNKTAAYEMGQVLAKKMKEKEWDKNSSVGIISIPQKRANGKARTIGFMKAMEESGIKVEGLKQQMNFSYNETYTFAKELIEENKNIRAIWLQSSDKYKAALEAIKVTEKENKILLIVFDAEPEFLDLIPNEIIVASAMQQPYLFGEKAIFILDNFFQNKEIEKNIQLPILVISTDNIEENISIIKRNVLGILEKTK